MQVQNKVNKHAIAHQVKSFQRKLGSLVKSSVSCTRKRPMRMPDKSGILDLIKNAPARQGFNRVDIARAYGVPSSEIRPFLRQLEDEGLIMFDQRGGILPRNDTPMMNPSVVSGSADWRAGY